jgi:lambda family phage tail tape measure protein
MATVGTLDINIKAGTAQFDQAMKQVKRTLIETSAIGSTIGNLLGNAFEKIGEKAGAAVRYLIEFGESVIDTYEKMGKLAEQSGTTTEKLSTLAYAGQYAGISAEELAGSMEKLAKLVADAGAGNEEASQTFKTLGVSVKDAHGNIRDMSDVLLEVARNLEKYRDDANKTAILQRAFGKSGAELNSYLHDLANNFDEISDKAAKTGNVVGTEASKQNNKFNDTLTEIRLNLRGLGNEFIQAILPAIQKVADAFLDLTKNIHSFIDALKEMKGLQELLDDFNELDKFLKEAPGKAAQATRSFLGLQRLPAEFVPKGTGPLTGATAKPSVPITDPAALRQAEEAAKIYAQQVAELNQTITTQKTLTAVIGQNAAAQLEANIQIEQNNTLRKLQNQLADKHKTLNAAETAQISALVDAAARGKAITDLNTSLQAQADAAELASYQAHYLADAWGRTDQEMDDAKITSQQLALTWLKNMGLINAQGEAAIQSWLKYQQDIAETNRDLASKQRVKSIQNETQAIYDQIAGLQIMLPAIGDTEEAQIKANIAAQQLQLTLQIGREQDVLAAAKLLKRRDALNQLLDILLKSNAAEQATAALSPADRYEKEKTLIEEQTEALKERNKGLLTYDELLTEAARKHAAYVQSLHATADSLRAVGGASEGVQAFFKELEANAKSAAETTYELLTKAFEGITDYLSQVLTGAKASFSDFLRSLAQEILKSELTTLLSQLLKGLSQAGGSAGGKGGFFGFLATAAGALLGHRAGGGMISANQAYLVGENGPELVTGINGYVSSAASSKSLMGNARDTIYYSIDARGTDPVLVEQRVRTAIALSHNSAVVTSNQVGQERKMRMPRTYR